MDFIETLLILSSEFPRKFWLESCLTSYSHVALRQFFLNFNFLCDEHSVAYVRSKKIEIKKKVAQPLRGRVAFG